MFSILLVVSFWCASADDLVLKESCPPTIPAGEIIHSNIPQPYAGTRCLTDRKGLVQTMVQPYASLCRTPNIFPELEELKKRYCNKTEIRFNYYLCACCESFVEINHECISNVAVTSFFLITPSTTTPSTTTPSTTTPSTTTPSTTTPLTTTPSTTTPSTTTFLFALVNDPSSENPRVFPVSQILSTVSTLETWTTVGPVGVVWWPYVVGGVLGLLLVIVVIAVLARLLCVAVVTAPLAKKKPEVKESRQENEYVDIVKSDMDSNYYVDIFKSDQDSNCYVDIGKSEPDPNYDCVKVSEKKSFGVYEIIDNDELKISEENELNEKKCSPSSSNENVYSENPSLEGIDVVKSAAGPTETKGGIYSNAMPGSNSASVGHSNYRNDGNGGEVEGVYDEIGNKKEKSTDCDSALIPRLCVHG